LIPANDSDEQMDYVLTSGEMISLKPLLNKKVFKTRIIPLICKLYCIRDLRIRSLLLQYLPNYASFISTACLRQLVLPQILIAMKDTNDELVALTFKAISHLVTIFGANVVLGPRLKLFTNGIPKHYINDGTEVESVTSSDIRESPEVDQIDDHTIAQNQLNGWTETETASESNGNIGISVETLETNSDNKSDIPREVEKSVNAMTVKALPKKSTPLLQNDFDIKELDFKFEDNEIDNLFSDMEPVFKFGNKHLIAEQLMGLTSDTNSSNKFAANEELTDEMGWTDHSWDNDWDNKDDK